MAKHWRNFVLEAIEILGKTDIGRPKKLTVEVAEDANPQDFAPYADFWWSETLRVMGGAFMKFALLDIGKRTGVDFSELIATLSAQDEEIKRLLMKATLQAEAAIPGSEKAH